MGDYQVGGGKYHLSSWTRDLHSHIRGPAPKRRSTRGRIVRKGWKTGDAEQGGGGRKGMRSVREKSSTLGLFYFRFRGKGDSGGGGVKTGIRRSP